MPYPSTDRLAGMIGSFCTGAVAQPAIKTRKMSSVRLIARFIEIVLSSFEEIEHIVDIFRVTHVAAVTAVGVKLGAGTEDIF